MGTADKPAVDPRESREEWLRNLDLLHEQVKELLRYQIEAGAMKCEAREIELEEAQFGRYQAKILDIKMGNQLIYLEPLAELFMGCRRVDVVGPMGQAGLILVDAKVKDATELDGVANNGPVAWTWKVLTTKTPKTFVDLDRKVFGDVLMQVFDAW